MKKFFTLLSIFTLSLTSTSVHANTVTIPNDPKTSLSETSYLPIGLHSTNSKYGGCFSVSQQLYFASELSKASSRNITAITFYCSSGVSLNRKLRVWLNNTEITAFSTETTTPNFVAPGTQVFTSKKNGVDNGVDLTPGESYTITLDKSFAWDGTSNIIVTVFDSTGVKASSSTKHHMIQTSGTARFLHKTYWFDNYADASWTMNNLTAATAESINDRGYVDKITFTFEGAEVAPETPDDLTVSATTSSSATLAWSAVTDATSYDLQQSEDGSDWSTLASGLTGTSYTWTGLAAESTHYVQIRANNAVGSSDWSSSVTVTTDAVYEYDGITFDKWTETKSLPTSGNYYINGDMNFEAYATDVITLAGNLNLCLNGKTVNMEASRIVVPSDKTLTIYNNSESEGKITSFVASKIGLSDATTTSLIVVKSGGTLVLKEGTIENTYVRDEDGSSYAIYSNGSVLLSGDVLINSNDADIYLYSANKITLDGPINNSEKHTIYKAGGAITSGWSTHMDGENPRDYFESANSARSVCLNAGEASLRLLLNLSESNLNSSIGTSSGQVADVNLTRSLTSSQYNTFCLPFALSNAQLQAAFGVGYDLQEFVSSSLVDETLELTFNKVNALEAGKPYLLKPSVDVVNPIFQNVTITATSPVDQTSDPYISFYGIYSPTELEGGNKNILFLGAENELFWPETTESLNGFRAYFRVKGGAAKVAKRARIINKEEAPTSLDEVQGNNLQRTKFIENGQLFILYNGAKYNVQGQVIK